MTELFATALEFIKSILHLDVLVNQWAVQFGPWLFVILFLVIFCETGLVVTPFLPGDSLLFAIGALCATSPHFDIWIFLPLLMLASVMGDSTNYWIGRKFGRRLFETNHRLTGLFKKKYLQDTEEFYKKRGPLAVTLARFFPIVRTFAPFVAGLTSMRYPLFFGLSLLGSVVWISLFILMGFFFGQVPFIKENFTALVMGIIFVSLAPLFLRFLQNLLKKRTLSA